MAAVAARTANVDRIGRSLDRHHPNPHFPCGGRDLIGRFATVVERDQKWPDLLIRIFPVEDRGGSVSRGSERQGLGDVGQHGRAATGSRPEMPDHRSILWRIWERGWEIGGASGREKMATEQY